MRKLTGFWLGYLCLVLLTACVRKDEPLGPETNNGAEDVGEAELVLPALPPGFLAKSADDTVGTKRAYFILTISGPGMAPRRQAWPLDSSATTIKVTKIPVGSRLFTGELDVGGRIAYADSVWALIEKGKTTLVHLRLGSTTGDAQICVEIEGLPLPAGCRPPSKRPDVSGCWRILYLGSDSSGRDSLRITQRDSILLGVIRWRDGRKDTARGFVNPLGGVKFGADDSVSTWLFSGEVDSVGRTLFGKFYWNRMPLDPVRMLTAVRVSCSPDTIPAPRDSLRCWEAGQSLDGRPASGRFLALERSKTVYGLFQWAGHAGMPVTGFRESLPTPISSVPPTQAYYLYGALPSGLAATPPGRPDSVHYKGQIVGTGMAAYIDYGTVNGLDTAGVMKQRGSWQGKAGTCAAGDLKAVLSAHRLPQ